MSTTLTPAEQAYFDKGGEGEIPTDAAPEPVEQEAPEPEVVHEDGSPAPTEKARHVPLPELIKEREKRKVLETRVEEQARQIAELRGYFQGQQPRQQPAAETKIPSFEEDPRGHFEARLKQIEEQNRPIQQGYQQTQQQQREAQARNQLSQWGLAQEAEFAKATPDYAKATEFLKESRTRELKAFGLDDQTIHAQMAQDIMMIAATAHQQQANFAERIYATAQARGYTPKQAAQAADEATEQLETINRGQQLSRSVQGAAPSGTMTAEKLGSMSAEDFDAWTTKNPAATRRLMGG